MSAKVFNYGQISPLTAEKFTIQYEAEYASLLNTKIIIIILILQSSGLLQF